MSLLRQPVRERFSGSDPLFRWRSMEVTRIEGFSDAAFAFAITLLVVSLDVPSSFDELMFVMNGFIAFAASFAILVWIWYNHYLFFQRYGIADLTIVFLNGALLFVVMFYVYPMKFMFTGLQAMFLGGQSAGPGLNILSPADVPWLYTIYSGGFFAIFGLLLLMHLHAWRNRDDLELNAAEKAITRYELRFNLINMGIATASIILAWMGRPALAGWVYMLLGPIHGIHGWRSMSAVSRLAAQQTS